MFVRTSNGFPIQLYTFISKDSNEVLTFFPLVSV